MDTNISNPVSPKEDREQKIRSIVMRRKAMMWLRRLVLVAILVGGLYGLYWLTYDPTPLVQGEHFASQGQEHIAEGAKHPEYNSNPPTSGWHYAVPAQSGIYDKELPDERLIHNLEHGHIWISYRPDLPQEQIDKLADIAKSYGSKMIVMPRAKNDRPITIAAWEYLLKLDAVDEVQIKGFIKAHRGHGPEDVPDFNFKDFRGQAAPSPAATM